MHRTDGSADAVEQRVDWFWSAATWSGDPQVMESAKCAGIAWYDLASLPDPVSPYERIVLEAWRDGSLPATLSYGFDT